MADTPMTPEEALAVLRQAASSHGQTLAEASAEWEHRFGQALAVAIEIMEDVCDERRHDAFVEGARQAKENRRRG